MKKHLIKFWKIVSTIYIYGVVISTTVLIWLFAIFGGELSIKINWESWTELIEHFR